MVGGHVEGVDHGWVQDVDAVVEHGDDEGEDEGHCELAAVMRPEDSGGAQRIFGVREGLPESE